MYAVSILKPPEARRGGSDFLEMELQVILSDHVSAGNLESLPSRISFHMLCACLCVGQKQAS